MWTYKPRQGRNAATVVCSTSAVVTLALTLFGNVFEDAWPDAGILSIRQETWMTYQVIARKYRPQRFSDVVGQEHVTQTLANAIEQNRIAHAYLFVGPRGTGKTTIARIFAKCLNCTNGPRVDFADDDVRCIEISEGRSLDVLEIDGASNRGIEEIRQLRETVKYAPANARFKIYIIDEVHMLTKEAFNALLKTLEEPPSHVKFMFATTEPEKVLATILSRCQRFDLRRIPVPLIAQHLAYVAQREKVEIEDAARYAIARGADGCMRDAQSTLDQLISFCGPRIVEADVLSMFGLAARSQIHELAHHLLVGDTRAILKSVDLLTRQGKELGRLLAELLNHIRSLLLYQISGDDAAMLELAEADAAALASQSKLIPVDGLTRMLEVMVEGEARLRSNVSRRVALEVILLQASSACRATSLDQVLQHLQSLRASEPIAHGNTPAPVASSQSAVAPPAKQPEAPLPAKPSDTAPAARTSEPESSTTPVAAGDFTQHWARILDAIGEGSPMMRGLLAQTWLVSCENDVLTLGHSPELADQINLLDSPKNREMLLAKARSLGAAATRLRFLPVTGAEAAAPSTISSPSTPSPKSSSPKRNPGRKNEDKTPAKTVENREPPPMDMEAFKKDPMIQQAIEMFKGRIAAVGSNTVPGAEGS